MGGATVLMTSGLELPPQVKGIISDCAFTSPKEVFSYVLKTMYHMPAFPIIQGANILNKKLAGYGTDECNASREVANTSLPILFIHGLDDDFVLPENSKINYDSYNGPKEIILFDSANHGISYLIYPKKYITKVKSFIKKYNN
jgi:fermentation-respiration switch protein FrsA (DUF1100 family)